MAIHLQAASLRADLRDVFVQNGQECRSLALVQLDGGDDVEHMLSILRLGRLWGHCTVPDGNNLANEDRFATARWLVARASPISLPAAVPLELQPAEGLPMQKRANAVTFKGNPSTLVGPQLKAGDKAPEFRLRHSGLEVVDLAKTPAKARLFSVVPSLDTPVCSMQTKKFDEALAALKDKLACYTISLDLPFAQKRFCTAENITNMQTLSDVHNHSFGQNYGVLIEGCRCRCSRVPSSSSTRPARSPTANTCRKSPRTPTTTPPWRRSKCRDGLS